MNTIYVVDLGRREYDEVLEIQGRLEKRVVEDKKKGYLLISENPPVITVGRSAEDNEVIYSDERLKSLGISKYTTERGGRVTLHGPGQVVGYPIINLESYKKDLHWYLTALEDVVGETLMKLGVETFKSQGKTGVWTKRGKICAMGVKVKRWVTTHGFALNHTIDLNLFNSINPCGLKEDGLAKIEDYMEGIERKEVLQSIYSSFEEGFQCTVKEVEIEEIL